MDKLFIERIAKQLASDYLDCLDHPKQLNTLSTPSKIIVLYNSGDEETMQFKKFMTEYFDERNRSIKILSENEIDPTQNHNYRINVRNCLENPPRLY